MTGIEYFLFLLLAVAVFTDMRSGKIPNWLILAGLITGIMTTNHPVEGIICTIFLVLIFFPLFQVGALGAGDIKCMAMLGLYLPRERLLQTVFYIFLVAAVYAVVKIIYYRSVQTIKSKIHLALPILLGVLISLGGSYR